MAINYRQAGDVITVNAPYDVFSGEGVLINNLFGVATYSAKADEALELATQGVFYLNKNDQPFHAGDNAYWDNEQHRITNDPQHKRMGVVISATPGGSTRVLVRLNGYVSVDSERDATPTFNRIQTLVLAPHDCKTGQVIHIDQLIGVVDRDAKAHESVPVTIAGITTVAKSTQDAFAIGNAIYWDEKNQTITTTEENNTALGIALTDAAKEADTVSVYVRG